MIFRVGTSGIGRVLARGGFALAATCLTCMGAQAQVVQGMTAGNDGSSLPGANVTSFADARSRVQIYANGPAALGGSEPAGGATIAALVGQTGAAVVANASAGTSLPGGQNASGPGGGGGTSPVPEPSTWLMMIAGFGLVGRGLRRRPARPLSA